MSVPFSGRVGTAKSDSRPAAPWQGGPASSLSLGVPVTWHCTRDGHFSIAVARNVTSPPLLLNSVHLAFGNGSECKPVTATPAFALFRFPFTSCGTTRRVRTAGLSRGSQPG